MAMFLSDITPRQDIRPNIAPTPLQRARAIGLQLLLPSRACVLSLEPGDITLDPYGNLRAVTSVHAQSTGDIHGKAFVCFYVAHGDRSTISHSLKEDQLTRTMQLSKHFTSAELDAIERELTAELARTEAR